MKPKQTKTENSAPVSSTPLFGATTEQAYATGIEAGRKLERAECWDAIKKHIHPGDIGGNGLDKHAQRNGMILALNIIDERIRQAPNAAAQWRAAKDAQYETETQSARPLEQPCWTSFSL